MSIYLNVALRHEDGTRCDTVAFNLPVARCWFEDVGSDLHIQFKGYEDLNICPHDNAYKGEFNIPKRANKFISWLEGPTKKQGLERVTRDSLCACTCWLESKKFGRTPPHEVMKDLLDNLVSPNRPPAEPTTPPTDETEKLC